jgi:uncharacterized membrane protein YqiK
MALVFVGVAAGAALLVVLGVLWLYARAIVKVEQGQALVVSKPTGVDVRFASGLVIPLVHRAELMDIRTKTLVIERRGKQGVRCRDEIRADLAVTFYVRVGRTVEDVLKVAQSLGCARAGDPAVLDELFTAKLAEAIETVAKQLDYEQLHTRRMEFKDQIMEVVGRDLNGFVLDDAAIDHIEQTPLEVLDPNDILDAEGIRKITERTTAQRIRRNELEQDAERQLRRQQLELEEVIVQLERHKADVLARFREATGRELTAKELEARVEQGLRAMVERVLDERR